MPELNRFRTRGDGKPHLKVDLFTRKGVMTWSVAWTMAGPGLLPEACGE
ncbi:chitinase [Amycolatopsis jiangsuensis]|uniref:Chitinase n=1 Tax=Amycolatopsis jiangsuensis TaxID=1181879 RepID=A0A840J3I4_9PSEU|nr:chitinase [Amycolatopsis jiangsuensis]